MRRIAKVAGVAQSTVSKALRNDPTISAKRCAEIQRLAQRLGYRPNPMVSALMAQLHSRRRRSDPHHIAWIDLWRSGEGAATAPFRKQLLAGARNRAKELGYEIEVHSVTDAGISPERLRQILASREQWGLIIPPVPESAMHFPFDMRGLAGVTIGTSLREPAMHRVTSDHYQGARLACDNLRAKGYRRIGLVLSRVVNERVDGKWCAAVLERQLHWAKTDRVPPLLLDTMDAKIFFRWFRRQKPDVIILAEPHIAGWAFEKLPKEKNRPAIAWLVLEAHQKNTWGIDHQPEKIGAAAVDLVVGHIHRNDRGSPEAANSLLLDGIWVER